MPDRAPSRRSRRASPSPRRIWSSCSPRCGATGWSRARAARKGGYRLSRPPGEITVGDVLRCLEGGLNLVDCLEEDGGCEKRCGCPTRLVWLRIRDGLSRVVDGITLQDMLDDNARDARIQGE